MKYGFHFYFHIIGEETLRFRKFKSLSPSQWHNQFKGILSNSKATMLECTPTQTLTSPPRRLDSIAQIHIFREQIAPFPQFSDH